MWILAIKLMLLMQFLLCCGRGRQAASRWIWWPGSLLRKVSLPSTPLRTDVAAGLFINVLKAIHGLILQGMGELVHGKVHFPAMSGSDSAHDNILFMTIKV